MYYYCSNIWRYVYVYNHNIILKVLSNKLKIKNINMIIDTYTIGDPSLELSEYDLVFMGIYNLREKTIIVNDLKKHINKIKRFMFDKTLFLIYDDFFYEFNSILNISNNKEIKNKYSLFNTKNNCLCIKYSKTDLILNNDILDNIINYYFNFKKVEQSIKNV